MAIIFEDGDVKIERETVRGDNSFIFFLRNFPTGSRTLTSRHKVVIDEQIIPFMKVSGHVCACYGLASRKGGADLNRELSAGRVSAVISEMTTDPIVLFKSIGSTPDNDIELNFSGEAFAESLGIADGDDDSRTRAVEVFLWPDQATKAVVFADKKIRQFAAKNPPDFTPVSR